jgi:hypothetical protein
MLLIKIKNLVDSNNLRVCIFQILLIQCKNANRYFYDLTVKSRTGKVHSIVLQLAFWLRLELEFQLK